MSVRSPVTGREHVVLEREISSRKIIDCYREQLNMNVGRYFQEVPAVRVYRCLDTGYCFYFPLGIRADAAFYEELQRFDWYYPNWRWEHDSSLRLISEKEKVLEIGCGNGAFLERLANQGISAEGLETNGKVASVLQAKGLRVLNMSLQTYAENHQETADVVCAFQVLEHIAHVRDFLDSALEVLKKGGRLLVSVPDNDSLLRYDRFNALNLPPHHMGLWTSASLGSLADVFGLRLTNLYREKIEPSHVEKSGEAVSRWIENRYGKAAAIVCEMGGAALQKWVERFPGSVKGITLLAEYQKA